MSRPTPSTSWLVGLLCTAALLATPFNTRAQETLQPDPTFLPSFVSGSGGEILAIAVDAEDRTYVGGSFDAGNGEIVRKDLMRLNPDGTMDASFTPPPGLVFIASALDIAPDGKVYVGTSSELYRLNTDGSLDVSFTSQLLNPSVDAIALDSEGRVLVGGSVRATFSGPEGIVRLDATGAIDTSFNAGNSGASGSVHSIAIQGDGKILIGGNFQNYNGAQVPGLARLNADGTLDTTFDPADHPEGDVLDIIVQPDGKILVGGDFQPYTNGTGGGLVRLEANGTRDESFVGFGPFGGGARGIHLLDDGRVLAVGSFFQTGSFDEIKIVRLTSAGAVESLFETPSFETFNPSALAIRPDGSFTVAGRADFEYESRNGFQSTDALFTFGADGTPAADFFSRVGRSGCVNKIVPHPDGGLVVGGQFHFVNGVPSGSVARINADGSLNTQFNVSDALADVSIYEVAVLPDGKILLAGGIFSFGSEPANGVVRLLSDGSLDPAFSSATPAFNTVIWMLIQDDGKAIVGTIPKGIFRLNTDGSLDETFDVGTGPDRDTASAVIQPDGKIVVVGEFENFNGTAIGGIVRLNTDGSIDNTFAAGAGFTTTSFFPQAQQVRIQPDGKLIVVGIFDGYNGTEVRRVVRINTDGTLDAGYGSWAQERFTPTVVYVQSDGKAIFGGQNVSYNGDIIGATETRDDLFRVDDAGMLDASFGEIPFDDNHSIFTDCGWNSANAVLEHGGLLYLATYPEAMSGFLGGGIIRLIPAGPIFTKTPHSDAVPAGYPTVFFEAEVTSDDPVTYQWQVNGVDIPGATSPVYEIPNVQLYHGGTYTVVATSGGTTITSPPATLVVSLPPASSSRLMNISTRALCLTGDNVLIPGFAVTGTGSKKLLVRAIGARLTDFGVQGALADPQMVLTQATAGGPVELSRLDDWGDNTNTSEVVTVSNLVGAFDLVEGSKDASGLFDLATGGYTVIASGVGDTTGTAIVEVFDADTGTPSATLTNISNRGFVDTGENIMIPGFVISDGGPLAVLIRAVGPTLGDFGVPGILEDPQFTVFYRAPGATSDVELFSNNDWESIPDPSVTTSYSDTVGAFQLAAGSKDAALVLVLDPGSYTVQVSGVGGTTGVALVEVYVIPLGSP